MAFGSDFVAGVAASTRGGVIFQQKQFKLTLSHW